MHQTSSVSFVCFISVTVGLDIEKSLFFSSVALFARTQNRLLGHLLWNTIYYHIIKLITETGYKKLDVMSS